MNYLFIYACECVYNNIYIIHTYIQTDMYTYVNMLDHSEKNGKFWLEQQLYLTICDLWHILNTLDVLVIWDDNGCSSKDKMANKQTNFCQYIGRFILLSVDSEINDFPSQNI